MLARSQKIVAPDSAIRCFPFFTTALSRQKKGLRVEEPSGSWAVSPTGKGRSQRRTHPERQLLPKYTPPRDAVLVWHEVPPKAPLEGHGLDEG